MSDIEKAMKAKAKKVRVSIFCDTKVSKAYEAWAQVRRDAQDGRLYNYQQLNVIVADNVKSVKFRGVQCIKVCVPFERSGDGKLYEAIQAAIHAAAEQYLCNEGLTLVCRETKKWQADRDVWMCAESVAA